MKTTYHRDATVTIWNSYDQQWMRAGRDKIKASPFLLATLLPEERARVVAHVCGINHRWTEKWHRAYSPVTPEDGPAAGGSVYTHIRREGSTFYRRDMAANGRHFRYGRTFEVDIIDVLDGTYRHPV